jgi:hypothetical protein
MSAEMYTFSGRWADRLDAMSASAAAVVTAVRAITIS